jgi:uncharacterized protein
MSPARVFLDADILFSVAYGSLGLQRLWSLARTKRCELVASEYVIEEAKRNLDRQDQRDALIRLLREVQVVPESDPSIPCPITLPMKDLPVFMAALSCEADYFVTGDITHFGEHFGKSIQGLVICPPRDFLDAISRPKK